MNDNIPITQFSNCFVRHPASSVIDGLRAVDVGPPDFLHLQSEHDAYIKAMKAAGVKVHILPALEAFPDSIFVEDPALTFPNGAIILRPGASSRRLEASHIAPSLKNHFETVIELSEPGFVEGGDVLQTNSRIMIGLSDRTNMAGASALIDCLKKLNLKGDIVRTPPNVLHLKTDCSLLDQDTVFTTRRLAASGIFKGLNIVYVPDGEEAAANVLRINEVVMIGEEFTQSIDLLDGLGYKLAPLKTKEISKIDAGLSCMSLRW